MQNITVGEHTFQTNSFVELVFPGANATLDSSGVLTLESRRGPPRDVVNGDDGEDGQSTAMQNVKIGDDTYTATNINTVEFIGATGVLNGTTLEVSGLQSGKRDNGG
ncbi:hypothetical protein N9L68_03940 [bacterium]|nr:hypothetical protein [bacterium]